MLTDRIVIQRIDLRCAGGARSTAVEPHFDEFAVLPRCHLTVNDRRAETRAPPGARLGR